MENYVVTTNNPSGNLSSTLDEEAFLLSLEHGANMKKPTAAQRHTAAHKARRAQRLDNWPTPKFNGPSLPFISHVCIIADIDGTLYRVDPDGGTARKVVFEK